MSFSYDAKAEVANADLPSSKCCNLAELAGIVRACGKISDNYAITLVTEHDCLYKRVLGLVKNYYESSTGVKLTTLTRPNLPNKYYIEINNELGEKILTDAFILRVNYAGQKEISNGISARLIENECCQREFVKGVFLGCASANIVIKDINDLKKHTGGYHLEFSFTNSTLAGDFSHVLSQYGVYSKMIQRKKMFVVYIKEAELVSDTLAIVGANNAVLTLQNEFAVREVRNQLNRQINCLNSNIEKMVDASLKQIAAIEYIEEAVGLNTLPDNLYELCLLRLANPNETLENLAKLMNPPLTKSGINHRLRKIVKIAQDLQDELEVEEENQTD
ncbi:MAG: DNA-binding protein WhiA [Clostridia bacterium]|nr:DNA-binding protein WhiA [Clostridia bacterium]